MTYKLYCVVNAIGVPYNDTFRPTKEESWNVHRWRDCPKDGEHENSAKIKTLLLHEGELEDRGDRAVGVTVHTHEIVDYALLEAGHPA